MKALNSLNLSIRTKIFLLIWMGAATTVVWAGLYFPAQQISEVNRALDGKGSSLARLLGRAAAPAIAFHDKDTAKEAFEGVASDSDFHDIALYGPDKKLIYGQGTPSEGEELAQTATEEPRTIVRDEVVETVLAVIPKDGPKDGPKGTLVLGLSRARVEASAASVRRTAAIQGLFIIVVATGLAWFVGTSFGRRVGRLATAMRAVAAGDLNISELVDPTPDEIGQSVVAFNAMLGSLRGLVRQLTTTSVQLNSAAGEFLATARNQERGASQQAAAVERGEQTIAMLVESGDAIAVSAQAVLENAQLTERNSAIVKDRITALSAHTQRITEIVEVIKGIANKSELLALNAALEGTRAGEAGKGFSLVAMQMQRLAESVMGSVRDIKELTSTISQATDASVFATSETTRIATDTTSSARIIASTLESQQTATTESSRAMEEVSRVAAESTAGSRDVVASATQLQNLSEHLQSLVSSFKVTGGDQRRSDEENRAA